MDIRLSVLNLFLCFLALVFVCESHSSVNLEWHRHHLLSPKIHGESQTQFLRLGQEGRPVERTPSEDGKVPNILTNKVVSVSPIPDYFDYIVVGSGPGGLGAASVLAADGSKDVLVLERGPDDKDIWETYYQHTYSQATYTERASEILPTTQGVRISTPKVFGGGSSMNGGVFIRENEDYFGRLRTTYNVDLDESELVGYYDTIEAKRGSPISDINPSLNQAMGDAFEASGFDPRNYVPTSDTLNSTYPAYDNFLPPDENGKQRRQTSRELLPTNNDKLKVEVQREVLKVLFKEVDGEVHADCVLYREVAGYGEETTGSDAATQDAGSPFGIDSFVGFVQQSVNLLVAALLPSKKTSSFCPVRQACVRDSGDKRGRIILSAGAVYSPTLLFKSGVGPRDLLTQVGIPVVKEVDALGKRFMDQPLIAAVGELQDRYEDTLKASLLKYTTIGYFDISDPAVGACTEDNGTCEFINIQGTKTPRGFEDMLFAQRSFFPPQYRNDLYSAATIAWMKKVATDNVTGPDSNGSNNSLNEWISGPVDAFIRCIRKSVAIIDILGRPKSRGFVGITPFGTPEVTPNYFQDPHDLVNMKAGARKMVEILNQPALNGFLQDADTSQCQPQTDAAVDTSFRMALLGDPDLAETVFLRHIQRRLGEGLDEELREEEAKGVEPEMDEFLQRAERADAVPVGDGEETSQPDALRESEGKKSSSRKSDMEIEALVKRPEASRSSGGKGIFPPYPVGPAQDEELGVFILNSYASSSHLSSSASMPDVVGVADCGLQGFSGLHISDASILPEVPRVNPAATIEAMGMYCGHRIVAL